MAGDCTLTGQFSDEVIFEGETYSLVGISGTDLPTPADFGMETFSSCTACWRGFLMRYRVSEGQLFLHSMSLNTRKPVAVNGVLPPDESPGLFTHVYENIDLRTDFTGSIMIAKDFISDMYVHMGFQGAESYRTVIEFEIEDGRILKTTDISDVMEERRLSGRGRLLAPSDQSDESISSWIEDRFSQEY